MSVVVIEKGSMCIVFKGYISIENIKRYENAGFILKPCEKK